MNVNEIERGMVQVIVPPSFVAALIGVLQVSIRRSGTVTVWYANGTTAMARNLLGRKGAIPDSVFDLDRMVKESWGIDRSTP
jgi:hypothetical protein